MDEHAGEQLAERAAEQLQPVPSESHVGGIPAAKVSMSLKNIVIIAVAVSLVAVGVIGGLVWALAGEEEEPDRPPPYHWEPCNRAEIYSAQLAAAGVFGTNNGGKAAGSYPGCIPVCVLVDVDGDGKVGRGDILELKDDVTGLAQRPFGFGTRWLLADPTSVFSGGAGFSETDTIEPDEFLDGIVGIRVAPNDKDCQAYDAAGRIVALRVVAPLSFDSCTEVEVYDAQLAAVAVAGTNNGGKAMGSGVGCVPVCVLVDVDGDGLVGLGDSIGFDHRVMGLVQRPFGFGARWLLADFASVFADNSNTGDSRRQTDAIDPSEFIDGIAGIRVASNQRDCQAYNADGQAVDLSVPFPANTAPCNEVEVYDAQLAAARAVGSNNGGKAVGSGVGCVPACVLVDVDGDGLVGIGDAVGFVPTLTGLEQQPFGVGARWLLADATSVFSNNSNTEESRRQADVIDPSEFIDGLAGVRVSPGQDKCHVVGSTGETVELSVSSPLISGYCNEAEVYDPQLAAAVVAGTNNEGKAVGSAAGCVPVCVLVDVDGDGRVGRGDALGFNRKLTGLVQLPFGVGDRWLLADATSVFANDSSATGAIMVASEFIDGIAGIQVAPNERECQAYDFAGYIVELSMAFPSVTAPCNEAEVYDPSLTERFEQVIATAEDHRARGFSQPGERWVAISAAGANNEGKAVGSAAGCVPVCVLADVDGDGKAGHGDAVGFVPTLTGLEQQPFGVGDRWLLADATSVFSDDRNTTFSRRLTDAIEPSEFTDGIVGFRVGPDQDECLAYDADGHAVKLPAAFSSSSGPCNEVEVHDPQLAALAVAGTNNEGKAVGSGPGCVPVCVLVDVGGDGRVGRGDALGFNRRVTGLEPRPFGYRREWLLADTASVFSYDPSTTSSRHITDAIMAASELIDGIVGFRVGPDQDECQAYDFAGHIVELAVAFPPATAPCNEVEVYDPQLAAVTVGQTHVAAVVAGTNNEGKAVGSGPGCVPVCVLEDSDANRKVSIGDTLKFDRRVTGLEPRHFHAGTRWLLADAARVFSGDSTTTFSRRLTDIIEPSEFTDGIVGIRVASNQRECQAYDIAGETVELSGARR